MRYVRFKQSYFHNELYRAWRAGFYEGFATFASGFLIGIIIYKIVRYFL